jgi:hypothetical protein
MPEDNEKEVAERAAKLFKESYGNIISESSAGGRKAG